MKIKHIRRCAARFFVVLFLVCSISIIYSCNVRADAVTDTISVRLGYYGMELGEYVEVGNYHWAQLAQNLDIYEEAYSFYQSSSSTEYTAIVDSARGFSIMDILDYANIYYGDIASIKFYVLDHNGIQAAFDRDSLFCSRYYFEDMPGHRTVHYATKKKTEKVQVGENPIYSSEPVIDESTGEQKRDPESGELLYEDVITGYEPVYENVEVEVPDYTKITGYTFEQCWNYCSNVVPMLAIEDNWEGFNEQFEHAGSNFTSLGTGNRFRLLFGQTSPTESLTSSSAKYVSRLYITLEGSPKYGEMEELDNSYGSHTVDLVVSNTDTNIRNALSSLMRIGSTDTNVLRITGITVKNSDVYSDQAVVTISYEIVGEGSASITAGIGSAAEMTTVSETVESGENPDKDKEDSSKDSEKSASSDTGSGSDQLGVNSNTSLQSNNLTADVNYLSESARAEALNSTGSVFLLSGDVGELLSGQLSISEVSTAPTDITEVQIEDNTEEQEQKKRIILIATALGAVCVCGLGFGSGFAAFEIKKKRKIRF